MRSTPKKSETLEIRLPHALKQDFMTRCRAEGRSASDVLRALIEDRLAPPTSLPTQPQEPMTMPRCAAHAAHAALAVFLLGAVAVAHGHAQPPDLRQVFRSLDADGDGTLSLGELQSAESRHPAPPAGHHPRPHPAPTPALFAALDTARDDRISFTEFERHHTGQGG